MRTPNVVAVSATAIASILATCACPSIGWSQTASEDDAVELPDALDRNEFMVTARVRAITTPNFYFSPLFEEHASHWSGGQRNLSYGGQFTWRRRREYELGVGVDWAQLSMPSQFWLERDEPADTAEYTEVDIDLLSITFTSHWFWNPTPWLSPYIGVGLGVGVVRGDILQSEPVRNSACERGLGQGDAFAPDVCFDDAGDPDPSQIDVANRTSAERVPPVVPVLNLSGGLRFNIAEYGVIRLDLGFNDYLYAGIGIGGQWW